MQAYSQLLSRGLRRVHSSIAIGSALLGFLPGAALAQSDPYAYLTATEPALKTLDENGVDLVSGKANVTIPLLSFASEFTSLRLDMRMVMPSGDWAVSFAPLEQTGSTFDNNFPFQENTFMNENVGYINAVTTPIGSGMTRGHYTYIVTNPDGSSYLPSIGPTHMIYLSNYIGGDGYYAADGSNVPVKIEPSGRRYIDQINFPNGEIWRLYTQMITREGLPYGRLRSVSSNRGATIEYEYLSDNPSSPAWGGVKRVLSFNKAQLYCNESAMALCSNTATAIDYVDFIYSDSDRSILIRRKGQTQGRKLTFGASSVPGKPILGDIQSIEDTGVPGSAVSYTYETVGSDNDGYLERHVSSVTKGGNTWNYTYYRNMEEGRITAYAVTDTQGPLGFSRYASGNLAFGAVESITDNLGRTSSQGLDSYSHFDFRIIADSLPEGNGRTYERDTRNNVTKMTFVPKPGSSDSAYSISATYPAACTNPKTCNKPLTVTDARGATTTYTYDPNHGGMLTKTLPAVNGISPVTRYSYVQRFPYLKNSSGGVGPSTEGIWLPNDERTCRTTATVGNGCAGGSADEVVTSYEYGNDGPASNLMLRGVAVTADGQTLRTCYVYNGRGDVISQTKPRGTGVGCP
ncbi:hypothetical protein [Sphingomonas kyeonggiensis]|uniref:YD repeat-containing protein n=1 Tax=Sphingomonas kyeonggiensis TaxID=1268553 RepID=A0A7W6JXN7_9SPHN|nr:hypothetical protein [Sphingomonas kyeonggiensis]MBB4100456.1 YD repeat-containing protein [Sphingomonas kyeonggiensis]